MLRTIILLTVLALSLFAEEECSRIEEFLFTVESADGARGSAFLMKDTDGVWMVSNYHVVSHKPPIKFTSMRDKNKSRLIPDEIEVAEDRDAIRFRVEESNGFAAAADYSFDDSVCAFGNSGGLGVITKNKGQILGIGPSEIEVSCEIVGGNSGGPVINESNQVVGIATYVVKPQSISDVMDKYFSKSEPAAKTTDKTRYADVRRFAVPVQKVAWQKVPTAVFEEESKRYEEQADLARCNIATIVLMCNRIPVSESKAETLLRSSVVRKYNREVALRYFTVSAIRLSPETVIQSNDRIFEDIAQDSASWSSEFRDTTVSGFKVKYFKKSLSDATDDLDHEIQNINQILESDSK